MVNTPRIVRMTVIAGLCAGGLMACSPSPPSPSTTNDDLNGATSGSTANAQNPSSSPVNPKQIQSDECQLVESGFGPQGNVAIQVETVVSGLEVPWGLSFLPNGDMLITERPGRLRLVQNGELQPDPIATFESPGTSEGGLLDIVLHPDFASNRYFYLYRTVGTAGSPTNRVERWQLAADHRSASRDRIILDNIPAARFHNGGRLRLGPDDMLYIGTGDARNPDLSQDRNSLAGKILRLTPEGEVPDDNPFPGNPVYVLGVRNVQGFDWPQPNVIWVSDHGPSGELGRTGHDEITAATPGDNLGWPTIYGCEAQQGLNRPVLSWDQAVPPGGAAIYTGSTIPQWQGDFIVGTLGSRHLHRVVFEKNNPGQMQQHEVYLQGDYGRLREVKMGPDGELYVTTSNCDGRGTCPAEGDKVLRITQ
jgi:glucose/arabinose dehydrogenase